MKRSVFLVASLLALAVPAAVGAKITASPARVTPAAVKPAAKVATWKAMSSRDGPCAAHGSAVDF